MVPATCWRGESACSSPWANLERGYGLITRDYYLTELIEAAQVQAEITLVTDYASGRESPDLLQGNLDPWLAAPCNCFARLFLLTLEQPLVPVHLVPVHEPSVSCTCCTTSRNCCTVAVAC